MPADLSVQTLVSGLVSIPELVCELRAELQRIRLIVACEPLARPDPTWGEVLTTARAADFLGVSKATPSTWRCTRRCEVPYLMIGGRVGYKRADLEARVETRRRPNAS